MVFLCTVVLAAVIGVATPVLAGDVINTINRGGDGAGALVIRLALVIAALAVADALLSLAQRWYSARIGEGIDHAWDFGGLGNSIMEQPGTFNFPADPSDTAHYTITLEVTNFCGNNSISDQVVVLPSPTAMSLPKR